MIQPLKEFDAAYAAECDRLEAVRAQITSNRQQAGGTPDAALDAEHRALVEAERVQTGRVIAAEHEATKRLCDEHRATYASIVMQTRAALVQLSNCIAKDQEFQAAMRQAGADLFANYLPPMPPPKAANFDMGDPSAIVHAWMDRAARLYGAEAQATEAPRGSDDQ